MELNKENTRKIMLLICFGLALFWGLEHITVVAEFIKTLFEIISPFILGFCFAFLVNVPLRPIEKGWDKLFNNQDNSIAVKIKRPVCLFISAFLIMGAIFILFFMVVPEIQRTVMMVIELFPQHLASIEQWWTELSDFASEFAIVLPQPALNLDEIGRMVSTFLLEAGQNFVGKTVGITASIFSGVFNTVLAFVFAVYLLLEKEKLCKQLTKVVNAYMPAENVEKTLYVVALSNRTFTNFVTGQLTEAFIIGILCFIGMLVLRMPYAPVVSVLVGFTALIPVFGAFFGTGVGAFLILMVEPIKAIWFILFIIVLQQFEGNIIYPRVVGKSVSLPGIWVLAAVTIGGNAFGVLGMLLGVPICSVLYSLTKADVNQKIEAKELA